MADDNAKAYVETTSEPVPQKTSRHKSVSAFLCYFSSVLPLKCYKYGFLVSKVSAVQLERLEHPELERTSGDGSSLCRLRKVLPPQVKPSMCGGGNATRAQ